MASDENWQQQMWQQPQQPGAQPVPPQQASAQQSGAQQAQPWQPSYPQQPQAAPAQAPYGWSQQPAYAAAPAAAVPGAPQPQQKKRGWIVALVAVILFFALMFAGLASCTRVMTSSVDSLGSLGLSSSSGVDALTHDAVGVIAIDGTIQYDGTTSSPEGLKAQLDRAAENDHIKAVVLRVNSGGGTATAGEEMATYVREFMEDTGKPVVVSSASTNASAAYEISSQADYIFVAKTTAIGAIGTAMQMTDLSGLLDKLGINVDNITSADSKDSSYGTRPLTEEERAYYQSMVDQINETFIDTVATGRNMSTDEVRALATGLTYTGLEAVENGLADEVGTLEDAVSKAAALAGAPGAQTVHLVPDASYDLSSLFSLMGGSDSSQNTGALLKELDEDGSISR